MAATMNVGIVNYQLPDETHNVYDVTFYDDKIHTLVTHSPILVDSWISEIMAIHRVRLHHRIVGLDIEMRPDNRYQVNRVATLQLCVGYRCLIFQLIYASEIPQSLIDFLRNPIYTFVGAGIDSDVEKLTKDYGLSVAHTVDLRSLAAGKHGMTELRNPGLKTLARQVLGKEIEKPERISRSSWDNKRLALEQVQYACIDAFLSFEIGKRLNADSGGSHTTIYILIMIFVVFVSLSLFRGM